MRHEVESLEKQRQMDKYWWLIGIKRTDDDGVEDRIALFMPIDIMEWRSAEYGISPSDRSTLLDVVIAESFMGPEDYAQGATLWDDNDEETTRRDHLARCSSVKLKNRISTRGTGNPLREMRDDSPMHPEALAIKAKFVRESLSRIKRGIGSAASGEVARVEKLRAQFNNGEEFNDGNDNS